MALMGMLLTGKDSAALRHHLDLGMDATAYHCHCQQKFVKLDALFDFEVNQIDQWRSAWFSALKLPTNLRTVAELKPLSGETRHPYSNNDGPDGAAQALVMGDPLTQSTFIDRRDCHRAVPMKVLCFGLGRTGTNSLRHALFALGYHDVYHYSSLFENPPDIELWLEAFVAKYGSKCRTWSDRDWDRLRNDKSDKMDARAWGREQWDQLLGHCMAVTDSPPLHFVPELLDAYPEAKVILTVRDREKWYTSYMSTIYAWNHRRTLPRGIWVDAWRWLASPSWPSWRMTKYDQIGYYICRNAPLIEFPILGRKWYDEHAEMVQRLATESGRQVMIFDVKDGWAPLCEFLGEDVPVDREFPRVNDTKAFMKLADRLGKSEDEAFVKNTAILLSVTALTVAVVSMFLLK